MRCSSVRKWCSGVCLLILAFVLTPAIAEAGAIAHWKLDDGQTDPSTTTAVDSIAPASNGTLENFTDPSTKWGTGIAGGALEFGANGNGTGADGDDIVTVANPDGGKLDLTGAMSISAWVLLDEDGGRASTRHIAGIDQSGGASGDAYSLKHNGGSTDNDKVAFLIAESGDVNLVSTDTLTNYKAASTNDGWVHLVGVYVPGTSMTLFVNGAQDAQLLVGVPAAIDSVPTPFTIGRLSTLTSSTHSFHGMIDDVQVYNMALSAADITALFENPGSVVPEPGSLALGMLSLLGLAMVRPRARRR